MHCHSWPGYPVSHNALSQLTRIPSVTQCSVTAHQDTQCHTMQCHSWPGYSVLHNAVSQLTRIPSATQCSVTADQNTQCYTMHCHSWPGYPVSHNALSQLTRILSVMQCIYLLDKNATLCLQCHAMHCHTTKCNITLSNSHQQTDVWTEGQCCIPDFCSELCLVIGTGPHACIKTLYGHQNTHTIIIIKWKSSVISWWLNVNG